MLSRKWKLERNCGCICKSSQQNMLPHWEQSRCWVLLKEVCFELLSSRAGHRWAGSVGSCAGENGELLSHLAQVLPLGPRSAVQHQQGQRRNISESQWGVHVGLAVTEDKESCSDLRHICLAWNDFPIAEVWWLYTPEVGIWEQCFMTTLSIKLSPWKQTHVYCNINVHSHFTLFFSKGEGWDVNSPLRKLFHNHSCSSASPARCKYASPNADHPDKSKMTGIKTGRLTKNNHNGFLSSRTFAGLLLGRACYLQFPAISGERLWGHCRSSQVIRVRGVAVTW